MGQVMAVCISEKKGTQKKGISEGHFIEEFGIENDAHAGKWHRQVSLLSYETIEAFKERGAEIGDGADVIVVSAHMGLYAEFDEEGGSDSAQKILDDNQRPPPR